MSKHVDACSLDIQLTRPSRLIIHRMPCTPNILLSSSWLSLSVAGCPVCLSVCLSVACVIRRGERAGNKVTPRATRRDRAAGTRVPVFFVTPIRSIRGDSVLCLDSGGMFSRQWKVVDEVR